MTATRFLLGKLCRVERQRSGETVPTSTVTATVTVDPIMSRLLELYELAADTPLREAYADRLIDHVWGGVVS